MFKYNGYFNGAENLKYGVSKLEKSNNDDYSSCLVFSSITI